MGPIENDYCAGGPNISQTDTGWEDPGVVGVYSVFSLTDPNIIAS